MEDRRIEPRLMCADLVELEWRDKSGRLRSEMANLEDLSVFGACVQCENLVRRGTPVVIRYGNGELPAVVRGIVSTGMRDIFWDWNSRRVVSGLPNISSQNTCSTFALWSAGRRNVLLR
jgi:hypothetical protein